MAVAMGGGAGMRALSALTIRSVPSKVSLADSPPTGADAGKVQLIVTASPSPAGSDQVPRANRSAIGDVPNDARTASLPRVVPIGDTVWTSSARTAPRAVFCPSPGSMRASAHSLVADARRVVPSIAVQCQPLQPSCVKRARRRRAPQRGWRAQEQLRAQE